MVEKILLVGWGFPPEIEGGLDVHVAKLFEELRQLDVDVTLVLPEDNDPGLEDIITVDAGEGGMMEKSREMSRAVAGLAEEYDIVHTHDWFGVESGLKAQKYSGTRWVATFHSIASGRSRSPYPDIEKLERAMAERPDHVLAVSDKLADEVEETYGERPEVIRNGFSVPEFQGRDLKQELGVDGEMILYVGRHAEQKGVEHLIYGFSKLDREATLVLGGEGHMREALEEFVEMLGIEEDVIFAGFIPEEELGDYYSSADVFVSPSINEPFGLTLTEAAIAGTPLVATDNGAEELLPGEAVVNVEPDSDSIKKGIEEALEREMPDLTERTWREVAEETVQIYRELN